MDDIVSETIAAHRSERDRLGEECLQEIWARMPWGHTFRLSNGGEAKLVEINGISGRSKPKRDAEGAWRMIFDFYLTGCRQDHIEVTMRITGGGGMA